LAVYVKIFLDKHLFCPKVIEMVPLSMGGSPCIHASKHGRDIGMVWKKLETYWWEPLKRKVRWRHADCP